MGPGLASVARGRRSWPGVHAGRVLTICVAGYSGAIATMRSLGGGHDARTVGVHGSERGRVHQAVHRRTPTLPAWQESHALPEAVFASVSALP